MSVLLSLLGLLFVLLGVMFLATYVLGAGQGALALAVVLLALSYLGLSGGGYPPPKA